MMTEMKIEGGTRWKTAGKSKTSTGQEQGNLRETSGKIDGIENRGERVEGRD